MVPCEAFLHMDTTNCNLSKIGSKIIAIRFLGVKRYTVWRYIAVQRPRFGSRYREAWKRYDNGSHPFLFERNNLLQLTSQPFCLQISWLQTAVHYQNSDISGWKWHSKPIWDSYAAYPEGILTQRSQVTASGQRKFVFLSV